MKALLKLAQLRWTGHITRMHDVRQLKTVFYGQLQEGKRSQGGNKKRYKDTLKASINDFNILFQLSPGNRLHRIEQKWRCLINKGAAQFESKRFCEAERKRKEWKARAKDPSLDSTQSEFKYSMCNRQFRAKIGLLLFICFKRVTHLAVIAILPCGPLSKHIYIYTNTKVI